MRRATFTALAMGAALLASASAAMAAPTPLPSTPPPEAVPGKKVCAVTDQRLAEISGLVATATGYVVVNAGVENQPKEHKKIFQLDKACKVLSKAGTYGGDGPKDPQDVVRAKDGSLWIADVGDPHRSRTSVVLWKAPANLSKPATRYRFSYPNGRHNAKALLLSGDGTPIIVTFETDKTAQLYVPSAAASPTATVPLKLAGKIAVLDTLSPNVFGGAGRKGIIGGAISPDGGRVALRTYADAFEWDVTGGDVIKALQAKPRATALTGEPFNESLTYSADGKLLISASMTDNVKQYDPGVKGSVLLSWTPSVKPYVAPPKTAQAASTSQSWFTRLWTGLSLRQTYLIFGGVVAFGVLLVMIGVIATVKGRKRVKKKGAGRRPRGDDFGGDDSATAVLAVVPRQQSGHQAPAGYPVHGAPYPDQRPHPQDGYPDERYADEGHRRR